MKITMELHGEVQLNRRFMRWSSAAVDATPVWESIYSYLLGVEKQQFASEGAQSGHQWAQLAASTVAQKARDNLRPEILRATDAMLKSLTRPDDPNQLKIITPSMMAFGSMLPYARMHQKPGPRAHYPQRRPIDLTVRNKVAIVKGLQLWLARGKVVKIKA
jgi:Phage virion morphogenesis family